MRHREEDVQKYAAQDMKNAIAFVEEKMGVKWDWKAYFECAKRVNETTRDRWEWLEVNSTPYPQFVGAVFSLYNDTNYMGNCGRSAEFPPIDKKIMKLVRQGYEKDDDDARVPSPLHRLGRPAAVRHRYAQLDGTLLGRRPADGYALHGHQ
ncbi:MAG: 2-hydroxyacyl-CoA dehydratase family protein [Oscillospiraceae bacterium]